MQRIMLLNPKGGCGKTTIATNLASYYSAQGRAVALMDYDQLGSSSCWLALRDRQRPPIHGIAAYRAVAGVTRSWQLRIPGQIERVVIDTPAGVTGQQLIDFVRQTDLILVPVLPSPIDLNAVGQFVRHLCNLVRGKAPNVRLGLVANRVPAGGSGLRPLERFVAECEIPFLGRLRDSDLFLRAAEGGLGIYDLPVEESVADREQWAPVVHWAEGQARTPRSMHAVFGAGPTTLVSSG